MNECQSERFQRAKQKILHHDLRVPTNLDSRTVVARIYARTQDGFVKLTDEIQKLPKWVQEASEPLWEELKIAVSD
jgi:hypothetical protein